MSELIKRTKINDFEVVCFDTIDIAVEDILNNHLDDGTIAVAINPEKILQARESSSVYNAIDIATLRYLDGIGTVWLASKKLNAKLERIPGCDLWEKLMYSTKARNVPVFILGASPTTLSATVEKLESGGVNVVGSCDGYYINEDEVIHRVKESGAKVLSVALGSPKQELFMKRGKELGLTCFMMGVGGTYDVFTGRIKRAPKSWQKLNLEWLYRLLSEPSRIFRQIRLLKFAILALFGKL